MRYLLNLLLVILLIPVYVVTAPIWIPLLIIGARAMTQMHEAEVR